MRKAWRDEESNACFAQVAGCSGQFRRHARGGLAEVEVREHAVSGDDGEAIGRQTPSIIRATSMSLCPACGEGVAAGETRCRRCGADAVNVVTTLGPAEGDETRLSEGAAATPVNDAGASRAFVPGRVIAGRFRIVALLGRGGMGEVYRADDLKLGQPVALKFLPAEFVTDARLQERLLTEVRVARDVSHPNVCRVYDVVEAGNDQFIAMEYIDGEDLSSLLRRIGRLAPDKAADIARQLCAGLAAIHDKGLLHRDLKPANVMLDGRGRVRVTDFGLAVDAAVNPDVREIAGTPAYMAPEQLEGRALSRQTDLYALGLILFELLTGRRFFEPGGAAALRSDRSDIDVVKRQASEATLDPAIERLVVRCLDPDPARRPDSALQVAAAPAEVNVAAARFGTAATVGALAALAVFLAVVLTTLHLARSNYRSGRADRRGAARVAAVFVLSHLAIRVLSIDSPLQILGIYALNAAATSIGIGILIWILYLALEPQIRRAWPEALIGWNRLLEGRMLDARVGADILSGIAVRIASAPLEIVVSIVTPSSFVPGGLDTADWVGATSARHAAASTLSVMTQAVLISLVILLVLSFAFLVTRRQQRTMLAFAVLFAAIGGAMGVDSGGSGFDAIVGTVYGGIEALLVMFVLSRFGILGLVSYMTVETLLSNVVSLQPSAWYSTPSWISIAVVVAAAYYGYRQVMRAPVVTRAAAG